MSRPIAALEKAAEENIRNWILTQQVQRRLEALPDKKQVGPYIIFSREFGAGGGAIAELVGQKLHWEVLNKEILDYMTKTYGTPRDLLRLVDEKQVSWIEEILHSWSTARGVSSAVHVHRVVRLVMRSASRGKVVIVGRGAQFILPRDGGFRVRILAPLKFRIEQVACREDLSIDKARTLVEESDYKRRAFIRQYFHRNSTDPHVYDVVINVEKLEPEDAASLVTAAAQSWMEKAGINW